MLLLRTTVVSQRLLLTRVSTTTTSTINTHLNVTRQYYTKRYVKNSSIFAGRLVQTFRSLSTGSLSVIRRFASDPTKVINNNLQKQLQSKPTSKRSDLWRLIQLAQPEKWTIGASVICLVISSVITMSVPYGIGKIMDIIFTESFVAEKLSNFCLFMVGIFVVGAVANFGRIYLMNGACKLILTYILIMH